MNMANRSPKRSFWEAYGGWNCEGERERQKVQHQEEDGTSLRPPNFASGHNSLTPTPTLTPTPSASGSPLISPFSQSSISSDTPWSHDDDETLAELPTNVTLPSKKFLSSDVTDGYSQETPEVCFGMLCDVKVRLKDDAQIAEGTLLVNSDSSRGMLQPLKIVERDNHIALQLIPNVDIAVLNSVITRTMHALSDLAAFHYHVHVEGQELIKATTAWASNGKYVDFQVEIIISGQRALADQLGSVLSKSELFLQVPRYIPLDVPYENPQVWDLGRSLNNLTIQPAVNIRRAQNPVANATAFLDTIDQRGFLEASVVDSRITQSLLSHQQRGVSFIAQREGWQPLTRFSLWDKGHREGSEFFEHKITGARMTIEPQDMVGGILADDMGLGKTLTMLSALAGSLSVGKLWAGSEHTTNPAPSSVPKLHATLVIVPSESIISQWEREIRRHMAKQSIQTLKYHGPTRAKLSEHFATHDVVLSTYATVAAEFRAGASRLHAFQWFRVVLDEAHSIRDPTTSQFRAIYTLSARLRWCLTGTPIQNSLEDLGALVRFLRISLLDTKSSFREHISRPMKKGHAGGYSNLQILLQSICLRRTKASLNLPAPHIVSRELSISPAEESECHRIKQDTHIAIETAVSEGRQREARRTVLTMILRLRLLCTYGTFYHLWETSQGNTNSYEERLAMAQQENEAGCVECSRSITSLDDPTDPTSGTFPKCGHLLCLDCLGQATDVPQSSFKPSTRKRAATKVCSICGNKVCCGKAREKREEPIHLPPDLANLGYSSKLAGVVAEISQNHHNDKSVVFSSWKRALYIVAALLRQRNITVLQIDGSVPIKKREAILASFENPQNNVLLMTLGTGAVGLNLTMANRVHIIEPQWNPSVEEQAIGRVLRLGQQKRVYVTRYIVKGSMEEYVRDKQNRKLKLAEIGFGGECKEMQEALVDVLGDHLNK
ncbi:SNF2 family N-terminal domain-containing protein [Aspergillus oleicola]